MPNTLNHNFKELLDSCNGNTIELQKALSERTGLTTRYIRMIYTGQQKNITLNNAIRFLEFFNENRDPKLPILELSDLFLGRKRVANDVLKELNIK